MPPRGTPAGTSDGPLKKLKRLVRTLQVTLPISPDLRFALQRRWHQVSGRPVEPDLLAIATIDWPPTPLFVDVGAHRGLTATAMLRLHEQARLVLIEPHPERHASLLSLFDGEKRVTCHHLALSDVSGKTTLFVPRYRSWSFDGLASLHQGEAATWLGEETLHGFDSHHLEIERVPCQTSTLDQLSLSPHFIKLDVQGAEESVLEGSRQTIERSMPVWMIETDPGTNEFAALDDALRGYGYQPFGWHDRELLEGRPGDVNTFWLPPEVRPRPR